jgi:hypothetical protein
MISTEPIHNKSPVSSIKEELKYTSYVGNTFSLREYIIKGSKEVRIIIGSQKVGVK